MGVTIMGEQGPPDWLQAPQGPWWHPSTQLLGWGGSVPWGHPSGMGTAGQIGDAQVWWDMRVGWGHPGGMGEPQVGWGFSCDMEAPKWDWVTQGHLGWDRDTQDRMVAPAQDRRGEGQPKHREGDPDGMGRPGWDGRILDRMGTLYRGWGDMGQDGWPLARREGPDGVVALDKLERNQMGWQDLVGDRGDLGGVG